MSKMRPPTKDEIFQKFEKAFDFKQQIGLFDTVQVNEDFFIGKQWEGVEANGLPTPTFNILKQVVNFQVATITSDNMVLQASPLPGIGGRSSKEVEVITGVVNQQNAAIIERNHIVAKMREFLRNAAVDGDGCMYFWFDPTVKNGQAVTGEITAELVENTRVSFGNPNCRDVQKQPHIIIARREMVEDVQWRCRQLQKVGDTTDIQDAEEIKPDSEKHQNRYDAYTDDKVTVLNYFYRDRDSGNIWCAEACDAGLLRKPYDTGYTLYPLVWLSWDYIPDCYHGQAMITGLLPNQKFINKMFALVGISLTTMAFPKVVYDRTKIRAWDGSVGSAIGVTGNVDGVAKTIEGATINPQIGQFMQMAIDETKSLLGASDVAMGDSRPDNTSAIIALQRAANTPMEMTRQNMYRCVEDMGRIWMDMMAAKYGTRTVEMKMPTDKIGEQPLGMELQDQMFSVDFDFSQLRDFPVAIKQDAGASSYWSEIASMQTLDNLLMQDKITLLQYLERIPSGYIVDKQKLIDEIKGITAAQKMPGISGNGAVTPANNLPVAGGPGNGALQRALTREGV